MAYLPSGGILARWLTCVLPMRVAIPHWQGRVSPVLDAASRFTLVDLETGRQTTRQDASLVGSGPLERARELSQLGADVVICGAVSRPLEIALQAAGLQVLPHVCGQVDEVLTAFINGQLDQDAFLMPGCCGRRWRFRAGRRGGGQCWNGRQEGGD